MSRRLLAATAGAAATALIVVIGAFVAIDAPPGDRATVRATHDLLGTALDDPARVVGLTGSAWVLAPLAIGLTGWALFRGSRDVVVITATAAAVTWLVNPALKRVITRDRPAVREFVEPTSRYAFPAGHAVAAAAFATVLVLLAWPTRWRWPVTAAAAAYVGAVGASRLVLGVHFPTDLVAGWCLGVAAVTGAGALVLTRR